MNYFAIFTCESIQTSYQIIYDDAALVRLLIRTTLIRHNLQKPLRLAVIPRTIIWTLRQAK
jgi:hypothetical protein